MGHCASYYTVEIIDTALAREILAKTKAEGIAIPSNIAPGSFIRFAADNNNINKETLYGKQTTHATIHNEEADTRLLLHTKHTASNFTRIVVQLSDTDVLVLCCSQFSSLGCDELWFHTGTRDKTQCIPVHSKGVDRFQPC